MASKLQVELLDFLGPPSSYYLIGDYKVMLGTIDFESGIIHFSYEKFKPVDSRGSIEFPKEYKPNALAELIYHKIVELEEQ